MTAWNLSSEQFNEFANLVGCSRTSRPLSDCPRPLGPASDPRRHSFTSRLPDHQDSRTPDI